MEALLTSECVNQLGAAQGIRKNSEDGSINLDSLTKGFVKARNFSGREFTDNPPSFHEIRSLAGRMYEVEFGKEFVQRLFGHKSEKRVRDDLIFVCK